MDHGIAPGHGGLDRGHVEHVAGDGLDVRVLVEAGRSQGIAPEGVEHDDLVVRGEALDEVRTDEAGTTGQKNAPSRKGGNWKRSVAHGGVKAVS